MPYYAPEVIGTISRKLAKKYSLKEEQADNFVFLMMNTFPNMYPEKETFLENQLCHMYNLEKLEDTQTLQSGE